MGSEGILFEAAEIARFDRKNLLEYEDEKLPRLVQP